MLATWLSPLLIAAATSTGGSAFGRLLPGHWKAYASAFLAIFLALLLRKVIAEMLIGKLAKLSERTKTEFDDLILDAIKKPSSLGIVFLGLWVAFLCLRADWGGEPVIDAEGAAFMGRFQGVLWVLVLAWVGFNLADVLAHGFSKLTEKTDTKLDDMLVPILRRSLKLFVGVIAVILIIQNLGYPIGALLAGFSIGGLAFALAAQDTLQNFFGSVMIFVDRPFQVGDWVKFGDINGVVEEVGLRSTRVRTFQKTLITVPNSKVAHEAIDNYSQMPKRRVRQVIGIGYTTEPARVEVVVNEFRKLLKNHEHVDQEFWLVTFDEFGGSSLDILVYYFTTSTAYAHHMRTKQELNLSFMRVLETLGVEIAFPTQTTYLRNDADPEKPELERALRVLNPQGGDMQPPDIGGGDGDGDDDDG